MFIFVSLEVAFRNQDPDAERACREGVSSLLGPLRGGAWKRQYVY